MKKQLLTAALAASTFFSAQAQTPSFVNAGFETWEEYTADDGMAGVTLNRPEQWNGSDKVTAEFSLILGFMGVTFERQLFQSSDAHSGESAARIVSVHLNDSFGNIPGVLSNASVSVNTDVVTSPGFEFSNLFSALTYTGGTPMYGHKVDTIVAQVKTPASNTDPSAIMISAMKKVTIDGKDTSIAIGSGTAVIMPDGGADYRQEVVSMTYFDPSNTATDTLIIAFLSSVFSEGVAVHAGNTLLVDDIQLSYSDGTTSTHQVLRAEDKVNVYPNPASTEIWFNLDARALPENYSLQITDATGRVIYQQSALQLHNNINLSGWAAGTYFYQITNKKSGAASTGTFIK